MEAMSEKSEVKARTEKKPTKIPRVTAAPRPTAKSVNFEQGQDEATTEAETRARALEEERAALAARIDQDQELKAKRDYNAENLAE